MKPALILAALAGSLSFSGTVLAMDAPLTFHAALSGTQETKGGDAAGSAVAEVTVSADRSQLCYDVHDIKGLEDVMAAHIHHGAAGTDGPPVVMLDKQPDGTFRGCVAAPAWLSEAISDNFAGYYINVHTKAFPAGAIRGQLGG